MSTQQHNVLWVDAGEGWRSLRNRSVLTDRGAVGSCGPAIENPVVSSDSGHIAQDDLLLMSSILLVFPSRAVVN